MNRRDILSTSAITVLGLAVLAGSAAAQQKTLKEQLVGTWTLVANDNVAPDGTKRQIFGPNPKGILMLDANGRFAQVSVNPSRPKFKGSTRLDGTPEENKAVVAGTVASFGTWSVNEADKTMVIRPDGNIYPNAEGIDQRRTVVSITGDEFKYVNPTSTAGGSTEAVYRRVK